MTIVNFTFTIFLVALAACRGSELLWPADAEPFEPREWWRGWYAEVEACLGVSGDYDRVEWFHGTVVFRGDQRGGAWYPPHRIVLTRGPYSGQRIVRHEMVHEIVQEPHRPDNAWTFRYEEAGGCVGPG